MILSYTQSIFIYTTVQMFGVTNIFLVILYSKDVLKYSNDSKDMYNILEYIF